MNRLTPEQRAYLTNQNQTKMRTPESIIAEMRDEMPYSVTSSADPYIREAMRMYAEQEVKAFVEWVVANGIQDRNQDQLFDDYQMFILDIE